MQKQTRAQPPDSLTMRVMKVWLWMVPIAMLVTAVVFGSIAAADGAWVLVGVMVVMGILALGLLFFHYWAMYRFGRTS